MEIEKGKTGIGTKERQKLKAMKVKILGYRIEMQKDKTDKDVGEKVTLICKHPEREENIEISSVSYMAQKKGKKEIKSSGLWFKTDEDGLIAKQSALASMLVFYKSGSVDDLVGKDLDTEMDDAGYLSIKAY